MSNGGSLAFFTTYRPRGGIKQSTMERIIAHTFRTCNWWFIVREKKDTEKHVHCISFPKKAMQRSNHITNCVTNVLKPEDWDEDSIRNFRRWDREKQTGSVKVATNLELIGDYMSGTRESKIGDECEILAEHLPQDLSDLEKFLPEVGALERPKNRWLHVLHRQLIQHCNFPGCRGSDLPFPLSIDFLRSCWMYLENEDHREIDYRFSEAKLKKATQWFNKDTNGMRKVPIHGVAYEQAMSHPDCHDYLEWSKVFEKI